MDDLYELFEQECYEPLVIPKDATKEEADAIIAAWSERRQQEWEEFVANHIDESTQQVSSREPSDEELFDMFEQEFYETLDIPPNATEEDADAITAAWNKLKQRRRMEFVINYRINALFTARQQLSPSRELTEDEHRELFEQACEKYFDIPPGIPDDEVNAIVDEWYSLTNKLWEEYAVNHGLKKFASQNMKPSEYASEYSAKEYDGQEYDGQEYTEPEYTEPEYTESEYDGQEYTASEYNDSAQKYDEEHDDEYVAPRRAQYREYEGPQENKNKRRGENRQLTYAERMHTIWMFRYEDEKEKMRREKAEYKSVEAVTIFGTPTRTKYGDILCVIKDKTYVLPRASIESREDGFEPLVADPQPKHATDKEITAYEKSFLLQCTCEKHNKLRLQKDRSYPEGECIIPTMKVPNYFEMRKQVTKRAHESWDDFDRNVLIYYDRFRKNNGYLEWVYHCIFFDTVLKGIKHWEAAGEFIANVINVGYHNTPALVPRKYRADLVLPVLMTSGVREYSYKYAEGVSDVIFKKHLEEENYYKLQMAFKSSDAESYAKLLDPRVVIDKPYDTVIDRSSDIRYKVLVKGFSDVIIAMGHTTLMPKVIKVLCDQNRYDRVWQILGDISEGFSLGGLHMWDMFLRRDHLEYYTKYSNDVYDQAYERLSNDPRVYECEIEHQLQYHKRRIIGFTDIAYAIKKDPTPENITSIICAFHIVHDNRYLHGRRSHVLSRRYSQCGSCGKVTKLSQVCVGCWDDIAYLFNRSRDITLIRCIKKTMEINGAPANVLAVGDKMIALCERRILAEKTGEFIP